MSGWFLRNVYDACSDYVVVFDTRRTSCLETFCKDLEGAAQCFIFRLPIMAHH